MENRTATLLLAYFCIETRKRTARPKLVCMFWVDHRGEAAIASHKRDSRAFFSAYQSRDLFTPQVLVYVTPGDRYFVLVFLINYDDHAPLRHVMGMISSSGFGKLDCLRVPGSFSKRKLEVVICITRE